MPRKLVLLLLAACPAFAQARCEATFPDLKPRGATMFSPTQEGYLGDLLTEQTSRRYPVYRQPGLTDPLDQIAARLLQHLPRNEYKFKFQLIELSQTNAFAMIGGKVFVSRRLIAFVRNEDELAGVLAHEMGHVLARQSSVDLTKSFNDLLKVSSVGDQADVAQKFHQWMDIRARKPPSGAHVDDDQLVADQVSMEAVWRAGYDPQGLPQFLDRLTDNKGATGNFITDLFGATRPESKRFREMLKSVEAIPASCREKRVESEQEAFRAWKKKVTELSAEDWITTSTNRAPTLRLAPKLRPDINNIKFSPDGRLLIAQDESGINILRHEPLSVVFRIPALGASAAIFDKDSKRVLFRTSSTRLEVWNLETRAREKMWEPEESQHCSGFLPSPDGRVVACSSVNELRLLDTDAGSELTRHALAMPSVITLSTLIALTQTRGTFSPDGSAFLLTRAANVGWVKWAFDIKQRKEIPVGGPLGASLGPSFTFLGTDRVASVGPLGSGVYSWPDGKLVQRLAIPLAPITAVTKGPVLLIRPMGDFAVAAFSLEENQVFQVSRKSAMDRYGDTGAAERGSGEIALYPGRKAQPIAVAPLPDADLSGVRSVVLSPDLEWLALSIGSRSAVWNLKNGKTYPFSPFNGGSISADGVWTTTFEQTEPGTTTQGDKKFFVRASVDLSVGKDVSYVKLPDKKPGETVAFSGPYEFTTLTNSPEKGWHTIRVKDTRTGQIAWTREMDMMPQRQLGNALVLGFPAADKYADSVIKKSAELKKRLEEIPRRQDATLLEVLDVATGKPLGYVMVDAAAGSVQIRSVRVGGRTLFLEDNNNRMLAYSLDTGERTGQEFGQVLAIDPVRTQVAVQNQLGRIMVFDASMQRVAEFEYPRNVIFAGFDGQGRRLLTVTGAQEVFIENLP